MKCFYHDDMDGHCSAAIVQKALGSCPHTTIDHRPINYNMEFPFNDIEPNEVVVIVDFSLQKPEDFERLLTITDNVVWIDHHKTAIEKHACISDKITGVRRDGTAACELVWEWYFRGQEPPKAVKLLGDYDVWAFAYGDETRKFQAGIRLYDTDPTADIWTALLGSGGLFTEEIIREGVTALKYRDNYYAGILKAWSFHTTLQGYKVIACNAGSVSSDLFATAEGDYDIMSPFVLDGSTGIWTVSLYTKRDDLDVSEIAKGFGGGGHRKASGFQCKKLPYYLNNP